MALEWLSTFVEDCFTSTGNCLPPPPPPPKLHPLKNVDTFLNPKPAEKIQKTSSFPLERIVIPGKARSKRKRGSSILKTRSQFSSFCWSNNQDDPPTLLQQAYWLAESELIKPEKDEKQEQTAVDGGGGGNGQQQQQQSRRCSHCQAQKTPQWRGGPLGPKTLCNACGVRYKSGRLLPEYRPAKSPTFLTFKHSNSHKKVMEMRMALSHSHPPSNS